LLPCPDNLYVRCCAGILNETANKKRSHREKS
jgi:hypothetical protein